MSKGRIVAGAVVVALVGALGAGYAVSTANSAPVIATARVTRQAIQVTVNASGKTESATPRGVYPKVAGTLASVSVADGQKVTKGAVLAKLDAAPLRLAVAEAESAWASARAMPTSTRKLRTARWRAMEAASAAITLARANLAAVSLKAPVAGTVRFGPAGAQKGQAVSPGVAVFTVADLAHLRFNAQVDEADIAGVRKGQQASVMLDAFATPFTGKVSTIGSTAVTTTTGGNAFEVLIPLTAGKAVLRVGMSGSADIVTAAIPDTLTVPVQAVGTEGTTRFVWVVGAENKVSRMPVTIGATTDSHAQILGGVPEGAVIATSQLSSLTNGGSVRVQ